MTDQKGLKEGAEVPQQEFIVKDSEGAPVTDAKEKSQAQASLSRKRNHESSRTELWNRAKMQKNREQGLSYTNINNDIQQRSIGPACQSQYCLQVAEIQCSELTHKMRNEIFNTSG